MKKRLPISQLFPHILHGGDYNPDQWLDTPGIIEEDMRLMKLAHCNTMTIGIFCWQVTEPSDGEYDFTYLDSMIDKISSNGGKIILATPSGSKPAWMSKKYPEILRTTPTGLKEFHGERHNHCFTSPVYRRKAREMDRRLAERYGNNDAVIAWHISNEFGGECHCELCQEAFRDWLRKRYGSIEKLNKAYWAKFWSHTYSDFDEIHSPSPIGEKMTHGLVVDWRRFVSDQTIDFMKNEIDAIKEYSDKPVTANLMTFYNGIDYRKMAKHLDFVSWDAYPVWHKDDRSDEYAFTAFNHDCFRSYKDKPFLLMECTPSLTNWHPYNKLKRPGVNRLSSLQAVAHGSDSVLYFQFRKSRGSSEKFHGAVVDHCGHENTRVFREVSELGKTLEGLDDIVGTCTDSEVAFLYEVDNRHLIELAQGFVKDNKKYRETLIAHYKMFWDKGINVDIRGYEDDFSKYKVIVAPMMYMVTDELIDKIEKFVSDGGIFVTTYMAGMANENDLCYLGGFPGGKLKDVFGLWNEEIDTLYPHDLNSVTVGNKSYDAIDYCEIIHPDTAKVLGTYDKDFYCGSAAVCCNNYGKGKAYYIAFRDKGYFIRDLYDSIIDEADIKTSLCGELGEGVVSHSRTDGENDYLFIGNYYGETSFFTANEEYTDMESGEKIKGRRELKPYESLVLKKKK
ncbi:MAG: beta-galactosidase [Clostridia bacterium]|nr:beta-galactosidase [Clostridia bacterium]